MLHPLEYPVLPKQWRVVTVAGVEYGVAMMPYPVAQAEDAACIGDRRFINDATRLGTIVLNEMRQVCLGCPLLTACREWGIAHETEWGLFGGLWPKERDKVRRERRQIGFDPSAAHEYGMGDDYWQERYVAGEDEDEWADA